MDSDVEVLRATEAECLERFRAKAKMLRAENPTMTAQVARAKAASMLHVTLEKYMAATSRLKFMGLGLKEWR